MSMVYEEVTGLGEIALTIFAKGAAAATGAAHLRDAAHIFPVPESTRRAFPSAVPHQSFDGVLEPRSEHLAALKSASSNPGVDPLLPDRANRSASCAVTASEHRLVWPAPHMETN